MIDLNLSNNKLYYRGIGIVRELLKVDEENARHAILRAVYGVDEVAPLIIATRKFVSSFRYLKRYWTRLFLSTTKKLCKWKRFPFIFFCARTPKRQVIPMSMLLAAGAPSVRAAREQLSSGGVLRRIIASIVAE